jgi:hypothetical protein
MGVYRIIRGILTWLLGGVLLALIAEFAVSLVREHGVFDHPTARVEAIMSLLASIRDQVWFWPAVTLLVGLVAGMWIDSLVRRRNPRAVPETHALPVPVTPPSPKKVFVDISPSSLMDLYKDKTTVQGDASAAVYIGKWIKTTIKVYDVSQFMGMILVQSVVSSEIPNQKYLSAQFPNETSEHVSLIAKDTTITVWGEINSITNMRVTLQKCELVEPSPT